MKIKTQSRLMLPHERDFFFARIKAGYLRIRLDGQVYKFELNNEPHRISREPSVKVGKLFTSKEKIYQLTVLMERYLKGDPSKWLL